MEGTRHEKAAIVGMAYFIGALTAFIGFGFERGDILPDNTNLNFSQPASVITAVAQTDQPTATKIIYQNGVLQFVESEGVKVISFNPETSTFSADEEFATQGMHLGILPYAVSADEVHTFFCEQKTAESKACSPFIYDALLDVIYRLQANGQPLAMTLDQAKQVTWTAGNLVVPGYNVANQATPWLLSI